jgi:CRISPR/Cas system CSM-associated protein Csm3 (group 7 of RAMP superfamily)
MNHRNIKQDKAKLKFNKTKKGKIEICLEGLNIKPVNFTIPQELDGKEVIVERENGKVVKIIYGDKLFTPDKIAKPKTSKTQYKQQNKDNMGTAKAPYNFVPLNQTVVEAEQIPDFDKYHNDRYTGYIDIEIENLTPLYIQNSVKGKQKSSDFFNVDGKYIIPGSSIRGMIRTLVEIISYGKFGYFNDERLYYRGLADCSNLRQEYQSKINNNVEAGYLYYDENSRSYKIKPAVKEDNKTFETFSDVSDEFSYEKREDGSWKVWSGKFANRKKNNWIIYKPDQNAKEIVIDENDIKNYKNDKNRNIRINLLDSAKSKRFNNITFDHGVPIFYTKYNGVDGKTHIAFGHTRYFRLPYEKTIGDHIPKDLKDDNKIDIAEAIFGKESKFASRVFFEDVVLQHPNPKDAFYEETFPKILSSPKPTCFQHYLEQSSNDPRKLNHWNSNAPISIRGNKLYWHRNTPSDSNKKHSWNEGKEINDTQHKKIKPLKENNKFKGRIRFENLSSVELGALLFAIDLPENCFHKLGMGKPLGLGSVKITIHEFFISDREKHYNQLFEDNNWYVPRKDGKTKDEFKKFKKGFEEYVLQKITPTEKSKAQTLWDTPRLKELKWLLNWQNTKIKDWNEKTRYMKIGSGGGGNEYKKRPVLPKASDVK